MSKINQNMIGDTLTLKNLQRIRLAMKQIKKIDRSEYFNKYFDEVLQRIAVEKELEKLREDEKVKKGLAPAVNDLGRMLKEEEMSMEVREGLEAVHLLISTFEIEQK